MLKASSHPRKLAKVLKFAIIYFVITAIAVGAIYYSSYYGGELVYEYGVGTAVQPPT
ncbi:hypothetical protein [Nostoc sp. 106C]|jgi:uncharacterized membrane protein|uniref:hypothetical protein n=1 Tax=Nostoc sp. 106C TaxID=1932667 RepID=UPI0014131037|nr:hypothetical protein [Nostoc sp. 106C]